MRLFYMRGACSLAVHIALLEAELDLGLVEVHCATRRTEAGCEFHTINPKSTVPALLLENGVRHQSSVRKALDREGGVYGAPV